MIDGRKERAVGSATKLEVGIMFEAFMLYEICFRHCDLINCSNILQCRRNDDGYTNLRFVTHICKMCL